MNLCLIPDCLHQNPTTVNFCEQCGAKLLLQDRYRALKVIGQGGFGKTFLARDEGKPSQPYCVIKQFLPINQDPTYLEKAAKSFKLEAERLERLGDYPQIPVLLAYCHQEGRQYLVQEYINGKNLAQELADHGIFNGRDIRNLLLDILPILDFIHSKQVIHRDIKPENIIRRIGDEKLFLVDFGAAKEFNQSIIGYTSGVIGTAQYAAPEQLRGESRYSSDLYSLGVTCLYLLTNVSPFDMFSSVDNDWSWREYLATNNPVSDELGKILDKLIQQAIKKRYHFAKEVLADLNTNNQPEFIPPPPVSLRYRQETIQPIISNQEITPQNNSEEEKKELFILRIIASCITIPYGVVMILTSLVSLFSGSASLFEILIIPFLITCCAFLSKDIAKSKNRDQLLWFLLGFPFHIATVLIIACLPIKD
ncbi:MAG: serine/threonine protein kinase [Gloeocapsa sp. DLM2.Bin57]|nr:MAG: serine/threonine protein kinase [Gloeocapsa sp. DLM2.Bin57]